MDKKFLFIYFTGVSTNEWLYTSELLKYYVFPNGTELSGNDQIDKIYYKNATLGPWAFCWLDRIILLTICFD